MRTPTFRRIVSLLAVCAAVAAPSACRGWESEHPPVHLNPNMDTQEKGKAYRKSDFFADGRYMRPLVPGTVARGHLDEDDLRSLGVDPQGNPTLKFPTSLDVWASRAARGEERYGIYCGPCHGAAGDGKGPVGERMGIAPGVFGGMAIAPPSFHDQRLKEMPAGRIYQAIRNGVNAGNMPSYAAQIPEDDRWAIVYHVRELQRSRDPSVEFEGGKVIVLAAATTPTAERGAQLFEQRGCNACHSTDGSQRVGPTFKGLWGKTEDTDKGPVVVDEAYFIESLVNPQARIVAGFPPAMPPQPGLSDIDVKSLILFVQSLK